MMSMLNMKKTHGRKGNKQGIILVMILFIFAISLILICCALMLTTGTRGRLYRRAEDSQARLTVTAAAESFLQALYMGDISDADLGTLADAGTTLKLTCDSLPGMSSTMADNQTELVIKREVDGDSSSNVVLEFTTTIDAQRENVQVILHYAPTPTPPPIPGSHIAMLETSGSADLHECQIGTGDGSDSDDNIVFVPGNIEFGRGSTAAMGSIYVAYGGNLTLRDGLDGGRAVVYGENGYVTGSGGNINSGNHLDLLMFINPNTETTSDTWQVGNPGDFYVTNQVYSNRGQGGRPASLNTATSTSDPLVSVVTSKVNAILAQNTFGSFTVPADAPQWSDTDNTLHFTQADGTAGAAINQLPQPTSNGQAIPAGTYYMTGTYGGNATVKYCTLTSGTVIYVYGNTEIASLTLWAKGDVKIIMLDGANLDITRNGGNIPGFGSYGNQNGGGIISTPARTVSDATNLAAEWPSDCGTDIPQCSIIGYGSNTLTIDDNQVLDSFVSLYNGGSFSMPDAGSRFYGRIIADSASLGNSGSPQVIPYCPGDSSSSHDDGHFHARYSDYDIVSFWYYY